MGNVCEQMSKETQSSKRLTFPKASQTSRRAEIGSDVNVAIRCLSLARLHNIKKAQSGPIKGFIPGEITAFGLPLNFS